MDMATRLKLAELIQKDMDQLRKKADGALRTPPHRSRHATGACSCPAPFPACLQHQSPLYCSNQRARV